MASLAPLWTHLASRDTQSAAVPKHTQPFRPFCWSPYPACPSALDRVLFACQVQAQCQVLRKALLARSICSCTHQPHCLPGPLSPFRSISVVRRGPGYHQNSRANAHCFVLPSQFTEPLQVPEEEGTGVSILRRVTRLRVGQHPTQIHPASC